MKNGLWSLLLLMTFAEASIDDQLKVAGGNTAEISGFLESAGEIHGESGVKASRFLVGGMPPKDLQTLKKDFLMENHIRKKIT